MPRKQDQVRSGKVVKYQAGLQTPGQIAYMAPNVRSLLVSGKSVPQDEMVIVDMAGNRALALPKLGDMRNGQALIISRNPNAVPQFLTVSSHPQDQGRNAIEYFWDSFIVASPVTFVIRRIDDPDGTPYWRLEGFTITGGILLPQTLSYQMIEINPLGTAIVIPAPGTWVPWVTGAPGYAVPGFFSNPAGSQIQIETPAPGTYVILFYASLTSDPGAVIEARVTLDGAPGTALHVTDQISLEGENPSIDNMAMQAAFPILAGLPLVLEVEFTSSIAAPITLFDCSLALYRAG